MAVDLDIFNTPSADFIIQTNDGESLKVHRSILEASSPFWKDLLSLPQCPKTHNASGKDTVGVAEDASIMRILLEFIYPVPDPVLTSFEEICVILEAAVKYEMTEAIHKLEHLLTSPEFLDDIPTRVYAIACRFELDDVARAASRATLRHNIIEMPLVDDFKYINAYDYHRLLTLHRQRSVAAQKLINLPDSIRCQQCSATKHFGIVDPPKWWADYERRAMVSLSTKPTSEEITSWPFLALAAKAGCARCGTNILEAFPFFEELKAKIDALPDTI